MNIFEKIFLWVLALVVVMALIGMAFNIGILAQIALVIMFFDIIFAVIIYVL